MDNGQLTTRYSLLDPPVKITELEGVKGFAFST